MGRGKRERRKAAGTRGTPPEAPAISDQVRVPDAGPRRRLGKIVLSVGAAVAVLAIVAGGWWWHSGASRGHRSPAYRQRRTRPRATSAARSCAQCHQQAEQGWRGSHHDLAMQPATDATVLGDFANATVQLRRRHVDLLPPGRQVRRAHRRPRRRAARLRVTYTFGVGSAAAVPHRVPRTGGCRRSRSPGTRARGPRAGSAGSTSTRARTSTTGTSCTGRARARTGTTCAPSATRRTCGRTTTRRPSASRPRCAEVDVACEACHGPGSSTSHGPRKRGRGQRVDAGTKGLAVALRRAQRRHVDDRRRDGQRAARRRAGRPAREIETCARCHARRGQLADDYVHGRPARRHASRRAARRRGSTTPTARSATRCTSTARSCRAKMFHRGVTCRDCHEPHSLKLRAPGNAVCLRLPRGARSTTRRRIIPPAGRARRRLRRLPHADAHLHGGRPAPRPQPPHPAPRSLGEARRAERLHALPRRPPGRVGGQAGGGLVRAYPCADTSATARRSERPRSAARARRSCSGRRP